MKRRIRTVFYLMALLVAAIPPLVFHESRQSQASVAAEPLRELASVLDEQKEVSVTVYNHDLALVKDIRELRLPLGLTALQFRDVASGIMPQTVHIKSLTDASLLRVIEQNYEYDLLTPQKLLEKFVGKEIRVLKGDAEVPVTILSVNNGIVYRLGDRIFTDYPGRMIFPEIPKDLISTPTLVWYLENRAQNSQDVEATYLTRGFNWKADYVAILDRDDRLMDLKGWVTLENRSGATYRGAKLKLVAGNVHRVLEQHGYRDAVGRLEAMAARPSADLAAQGFFEYHLYSLERPTTIKNNQTKQVSLLTANGVPVTKHFIYFGAEQYYRTQYGVPVSNQKVGVYMEIANKEQNRLGMPLPKGIVRVYKADADGSLQYVGEDRIDHTPKDEIVKIRMGEAFDIVGERKQTDWRRLGSNLYEVAFEISLRNHKDSPVTVSVVEPIPGDWEILQRTHDFTKIDAHTVQFDIPLDKNEEAKLRYRVRLRF